MRPQITVQSRQAKRAVPFSLLWRNYPTDLPCLLPNGDPPSGFENQCAIKMSLCLELSGVTLKGLGNDCPVAKHPGRALVAAASKLATWLTENRFPGCGRREKYAGQTWRGKCEKRSGIIFFKHYWCRSGEAPGACTGNHIDLWNGRSLSPGWASFFRFDLGIDRLPNPFSEGNFYSDLGQSREVWFLPVP